ncbi:M48 family metalloprotease [Archangium violaceum]|uniref:M48 family metalloprotease n=1 Tax=Archangium violaceum TaxID=83451 RepID=UPI001951C0AE|nr:M48 family metalloprotease [Archangium violaceum]QRN95438.1 M48 family metalloprotease [Archangium violaceum]
MVQQLARNPAETPQALSRLGRIEDDRKKAERRIDEEMGKDCIALKARTISIEEEYAFGGAVSVNWVSKGGGLTQSRDAEALHVQLNRIGKNLAAQSSRPHLTWTFGVLQSEGVNAVSGPGGYVFVTEGLLARLDNEAQLAGVLAHEIAHITGKHALNEYQKFLVDQCEGAVRAEKAKVTADALKQAGRELMGPAPVIPPGEWSNLFKSLVGHIDFDALSKDAIKAITDGVVARMSDKGFSQEDEFAADTEAVNLMAAAGYAPEEYVAFLSKLPDSGLSTAHPSKQKRQSRLNKYLEQLREPARNNEFTTSVDLSQTKVVPLRDTLQSRHTGTAARSN